jgi:hypothetical protein
MRALLIRILSIWPIGTVVIDLCTDGRIARADPVSMQISAGPPPAKTFRFGIASAWFVDGEGGSGDSGACGCSMLAHHDLCAVTSNSFGEPDRDRRSA